MPSKLNRDDVLANYPWIETPELNCILSPDTDGFLCGLFMSHFYGWKIKGYYDGKALLLEDGVDMNECVFLDIEIARPDIRSVGQHLLYHNAKHKHVEQMFSRCLSPNNLRGIDFRDFSSKFPFATIHLLVWLLLTEDKALKDATPLFYADSTYKNMLNYVDNCLDWLDYLDFKNNGLVRAFRPRPSLFKLMKDMSKFKSRIAERNERSKSRGNAELKADTIPLLSEECDLNKVTGFESCSKCNEFKFRGKGKSSLDGDAISVQQKQETEWFLRLLARKTGWDYDASRWSWNGYKAICFETGQCPPANGRFNQAMTYKPWSWALWSDDKLKFTLFDPFTFNCPHNP